MKKYSILKEWDMDEDYFSELVRENPSLKGMILGYAAEKKLKDFFVELGITENHRKDDDHDRTKKGDLTLTYKDVEVTIEVKSLQTNSVKATLPNGEIIPLINKVEVGRKPSTGLNKYGKPKLGSKIYKNIPNERYLKLSEEEKENAIYTGAFQCDASDRREITLDNGEKVSTTLLKVGEFDIIAAGIYSFRNKWEFAFALNEDLPRSDQYGENSSHLIASLVNITYPLQEPFVSDPKEILEKVRNKKS
ncbi:MAG: hypothetical protein ACRCR1_08570 [Aeromonas sp.]